MPIFTMSYSRAQSAGEAGLMEGAKQIFADNLKTMEPIAERNTTLPRIPRRGMVEPDGIEPTTSCLQSTRSPN